MLRSLCTRLALLVFIGAAVFSPTTVSRVTAQNSGPVASYALSEGSGTTTADASGNGNTGTLQGATAWTTGYFGNGISISGAYSTGVQVPMSSSLASITTAYTLEGWVNLTDISQSQTVVSLGSGSTFQGLYVSWGIVRLRAWINGTQYQISSPSPIVANQWTHVAGTYDGPKVHVYINGVEVAHSEASGPVLPSSDPMQIGGAVFQPFTGKIDEVRVYKVALDASAIAEDMITPVDQATAFQVGVKTPANGALGVRTTPITAGFTRPADPSTVTTSTFVLYDNLSVQVPATVSYDAASHRATLTPVSALNPLTQYMARVVGSGSGVKDVNGNALAGDVTWSFTTAAPVTAPVAAYALSEGTGITTADNSGNGNTGTLQGATSWTTGYFGNAISINGAYGTGVQVWKTESLAAISSAYTLEAWVNFTNTSQNQSVVSFGSGTTFQSLYVSYGIVRLRAWINGTQYQISSPSAIAANQWTHLAGTYDGSALHIYVNGVEVANGAASGPVLPSSDPLQIGAAVFQPFTGKIDEVRVYQVALNALAIAEDMTSPVDSATAFQVGVTT